MISAIHPTAIIESGAQIDPSAKIGPYAVIGEQVIIGENVEIGSHTVIEGKTRIGRDTKIGHFAAIGGAPQDMKYAGEPTALEIGERNTIREFTTIHVGTAQDGGVTRIGNDNWIMAYVHIAHDCQVGHHTIFSSNAQIAGHVKVGDWAILGGMCGVHQFVRIGAHSLLGGASALVKDLPPYLIAAGEKARARMVNIEGLKRRNFSTEQIQAIKEAFRIFYQSSLPHEEAFAKMQADFSPTKAGATEVNYFLDFIKSSQRGVFGNVVDDQ